MVIQRCMKHDTWACNSGYACEERRSLRERRAMKVTQTDSWHRRQPVIFRGFLFPTSNVNPFN